MCLVMDEHPSHCTKFVIHELLSYSGLVVLILPPASPNLCSVEFCN